jgi:putative SOS response-associated peptidase YedK
MAFAGLWERWTKGEQPIESCTIITTDAGDAVSAIHDRMPVILPPEEYDRWLDPHADPQELTGLLLPYPLDDLTARAVSRTVNSPRNDTPECVEPL